ncbi:MAG: SDR family oxidoreductase [Bacilli bacterium]|nr:SDR family oxidoreductase [Bacilli bacterium]MBN2696186.1 SDR family oxidoreductase [Bacilli bacterium]
MKRVALITGGTGGIGFATARELGLDDYHIVLNGIFPDQGVECVKKLTEEGISAEYVNFDCTDEAQVNQQIAAIGLKHGKIDALINAAGGLFGRSSFEDMSTEFYRSVMALNLDTVFFVTRASIPYLKKSDDASVINFTSIAGYNAGGPGAGVYGTAKGAVMVLTRALAKDLAKFSIRVNAVSPGTIDTPFHQETKTKNPQLFESWKNLILMKRFGEASEVASVIAFLVSKKASFITGETIQVNGGQDFL